MKLLKTTQILAFLTVVLFATTGCQKEEKQLVSTWQCTLTDSDYSGNSYTETHVLTLNDNDSFTWSITYSSKDYDNEYFAGTYLFDNENSKIYFTSHVDNSTISYMVSMLDDKLVLSDYKTEGEEGVLVFEKN